MEEGVDKGVRQGKASFQSSLRDGKGDGGAFTPSDKSLGYYRMSLRDQTCSNDTLRPAGYYRISLRDKQWMSTLQRDQRPAFAKRSSIHLRTRITRRPAQDWPSELKSTATRWPAWRARLCEAFNKIVPEKQGSSNSLSTFFEFGDSRFDLTGNAPPASAPSAAWGGFRLREDRSY